MALFSRGIRTADAIENIIADIHGSHDSGSVADQLWKERIESVSTKAQVTGITNGLHINIGLDAGEKRNHDRAISADRLFALHAIHEMTVKNLYLLGMNDDDRIRYKARNNLKRLNSHGLWVENAIPSADSNPYYAVMLTLAGTLKGLRAAHGANGHGVTPIKPSLDISEDEAKNSFFTSNNELRSMINSLDITKGSLGDQFFTAIEKTPPHTEPRLYNEPSRVRL
jgi:hypothetical protein